jgi:hypothetical protein
MPSPLVVRWRTETTWTVALKLNARQKAIEAKVEVQTGLLAIRNDIQSRGDLISNGDANGIVLHFRDVICAELVQVLGCKLKPAWEWVGADDGGTERDVGHNLF